MKYAKVLGIMAVASASCVQANPLPQELSSILERQKNVLAASDLSSEEREYLWKDTELDRRGYIRTVGSFSYMNMVEEFVKHPHFRPVAGRDVIGSVAGQSIKKMGTLPEDKTRVVHVFTWNNRKIALSTFFYKVAGVRPVVAEEFLTQEVAGTRATLALSVAKETEHGMWKVGWMSNEIDYELWVPDNLDSNNDPALDASTLLELAAVLAKVVK